MINIEQIIDFAKEIPVVNKIIDFFGDGLEQKDDCKDDPSSSELESSMTSRLTSIHSKEDEEFNRYGSITSNEFTTDPSSDELESSGSSRLTSIDIEDEFEESYESLIYSIKSECDWDNINELLNRYQYLGENLVFKEEFDNFIDDVKRLEVKLTDSINNRYKLIENLINRYVEYTYWTNPIENENLEEIQKIRDKTKQLQREIMEDFKKWNFLQHYKNKKRFIVADQRFMLCIGYENIQRSY